MSQSNDGSMVWTHSTGDYFVSTDPRIIPREELNQALQSDQLPRAQELSDAEMQTMLANSLSFGLYEKSTSRLIGFARLVTDRTTFVYLTDVYVLEQWQRRGLADWLMQCVKQYTGTIKSMRQLTLIVVSEAKEKYYGTRFGTKRFEDFGSVRMLVAKGPAGRF